MLTIVHVENIAENKNIIFKKVQRKAFQLWCTCCLMEKFRAKNCPSAAIMRVINLPELMLLKRAFYIIFGYAYGISKYSWKIPRQMSWELIKPTDKQHAASTSTTRKAVPKYFSSHFVVFWSLLKIYKMHNIYCSVILHCSHSDLLVTLKLNFLNLTRC